MGERIVEILLGAGAVAVGVCSARPVEEKAWKVFEEWLESGSNADMSYMGNYPGIRKNPQLLLEGAETIISLAFPFAQKEYRDIEKGMIACYAYGDDYHDVIRRRLGEAVKKLKENFGGDYRICIDSAPVLERYWAEKSGIGRCGENGMVIVPGYGSMVFLAEIVTTLELEERSYIYKNREIYKNGGERRGIGEGEDLYCNRCGKCRRSCPGGAINEAGIIDSRRCLSYLTIEHRGEWESREALEAVNTPAGKRAVFGCDFCLRSCPLNQNLPSCEIEEFQPRHEIFHLDASHIEGMTQEEFTKKFKLSPIKRAKLAGLKRNSQFFYKNS